MAVVSVLDFKLGARMLRRYPGLSLIGGLALSFAIALGVLAFQLVHNTLTPSLPLDQGSRVVRIENVNRLTGSVEPHALFDLQLWRDNLKSVVQLGAAWSVDRNLVLPGQPPRPVPVAELTPDGFALTRVPPLLGRPLVDADARAGAPDVTVIAYDLWKHQLGGDPDIVGKTVQLGATRATIVGVMPKGFGFPRYQQAWLPLRETALTPGDGPPVLIFARLAPGATLESAQSELQAVGARMVREDSTHYGYLQPRIVPFANTVLPVATRTVILVVFAGVFLILVGISANVATLMFARTTLRESEIALRTTLGASRRRIVAQLLIESLVLSGAAAVAGLLLARGVLQFIWYEQVTVRQVPQPFWHTAALSPSAALWAAGLGCIGAVLVGLLPALKATGAKVQNALARSPADAPGMRFGGVWSFVIVAQVTFSVVCLPIAIGTTREALRDAGLNVAISPHEYLTFQTQFDEAAGPKLEAAYAELDRRLLDDPSVAAVTHASALPGTDHDARRMEARRGTGTPHIVEGQADGMILSSRVDLNFFRVFPLPILLGRGFDATDVGRQTVIVNDSLAHKLGGNPIGMQIRDVAPRGPRGEEGTPGPWLDVVGVVKSTGLEGITDVIYQATEPADVNPGYVAVRLRGDMGSLVGRIPRMAFAIDPELRVYQVSRLDDVVRQRALSGTMAYIGVLSAIVLAIALSAAGLFALMAVSVQRRTREIGIRLALGASSRGVLRALFARAATQLIGGIVLGNLLVFGVRTLVVGTVNLMSIVPMMLGISTLMALIGVGACAVPARRALRVQPTEAIRGVV